MKITDYCINSGNDDP